MKKDNKITILFHIFFKLKETLVVSPIVSIFSSGVPKKSFTSKLAILEMDRIYHYLDRHNWLLHCSLFSSLWKLDIGQLSVSMYDKYVTKAQSYHMI